MQARVYQGPMPNDRARAKPQPIAPSRPCARCGRTFEPTAARRMLCRGCFKAGERPRDVPTIGGDDGR